MVKTPSVIKPLYTNLIWDIKTSQKEVYLTFDDGPTLEVTDKVLEILAKYNAKATFFLIGKNVAENPEYLLKFADAGHSIGNHTQNHENGWKTENGVYTKSVEKASNHIDSKLFRPPYGRIKRSQIKELKNSYSIIMWDVLSGDFDPKISVEKCVANVCNNCHSGSIIVFHDSVKAKPIVLEALPIILEKLRKEGYSLPALR